MPEDITASADTAAAPIVTLAVPAIVPAIAPGDEGKITLSKSALDDRIAQAKRSAYAELGVTDAAAAKAAIAAHKAQEEANKSELQKAHDKNAELTAQAATATAQLQAMKALADPSLAGIDDDKRGKLMAAIDSDPAGALKAIGLLKELGFAYPAAQPIAAPVAPKAAPASTTSSPAAPAGSVVIPTNPRQEWEALQKSNPVQAALYLARNAHEIFPPKS